MNLRPNGFLLALILLWACHGEAAASGLRVGGLALETNGEICLDLEWDHAWNRSDGAANHDAAWVFLKWQDADGLWQPLIVGSNGHLQSGSAVLEHVNDGLGLFVLPPLGTLGSTGPLRVCIPLQDQLPAEAQAVRAFAIEMVWIPDGGFWLGDGQSNGSFGTSSNQPFWVENEAEIPYGVLSDTGVYAPSGPIPAAWPKGSTGFHCMKHEISQSQYCDFLNTLSFAQQASHTAISPESEPGTLAMTSLSANRNGIRIRKAGTAPGSPATYGLDLDGNGFDDAADGLHRACNWLSWADLTAYLDWAGLRPLTEMEYEKACRGPLAAIPGEFAWGTTTAIDANTILADGHANEGAAEHGDSLQGLASHGYDGPQGPLRTGFAAGAGTGRVAAGATFHGVMEMSGNLWEQCVTVNTAGLQYQAEPGDGVLSPDGQADPATWPGAEGAGFRGGGWNSGIIAGFRDLAISDRFYAGLAPSARRNTSGGRGAR